MNKTETAKLQKILTTYLKEIREIYTEGNFRERNRALYEGGESD